jgi:dCMP deaminase
VAPDKTILSLGFNGMPRGFNENIPARYERPAKYLYMEHAERNTLYSAARQGVSLIGSSAYITAPPCIDCARGLIQTGVVKVMVPKDHEFANRKDWKDNFKESISMMRECHVEYSFLECTKITMWSHVDCTCGCKLMPSEDGISMKRSCSNIGCPHC